MAKKKEMDRTAGTARRKMSESERISYGIKTNQPLTGSASGVKSINLRQAGEALTQGIVTSRGGKLQVAPEGLAMALPVGKLVKAAQVLRGAGKIAKASALEARVFAKAAGGSKKGIAAINAIPGRSMEGVSIGSGLAKDARKASEKIYPRAKFGPNPMAEGTLNIVDTRRMNPAQAKSALESGVKQTATFKRRVPKTTSALPVTWPWDKAKRGR